MTYKQDYPYKSQPAVWTPENLHYMLAGVTFIIVTKRQELALDLCQELAPSLIHLETL